MLSLWSNNVSFRCFHRRDKVTCTLQSLKTSRPPNTLILVVFIIPSHGVTPDSKRQLVHCLTDNSSKLLIKIATANYAHRLCHAASARDIFQHQTLAFSKCFSPSASSTPGSRLSLYDTMSTNGFLYALFWKETPQLLPSSSVPSVSVKCYCDVSTHASAFGLHCVNLIPTFHSSNLSVCLAFLACCPALFHLSVREVRVELSFVLTSLFFFFLFHCVIPDRLWPDSLRAADVRLISGSPDTLPGSICLQTCPLPEPCCMTAAGPFQGYVASARSRPIRWWKGSLNTHVHPCRGQKPICWRSQTLWLWSRSCRWSACVDNFSIWV